MPPGFSQNQIFVSSDGSQWIFSASQNKWISTGTPYNPNAPGAPAPAAPASSYYPGSPVPANWSTSQVFTDSTGNQWAYNPGYGTFQMMPSLAPGSSAAPAAAGSSTVVTNAASENTVQSILDWASQSTWISGIPNWVLGLGIGLLGWKFMQPAGARR